MRCTWLKRESYEMTLLFSHSSNCRFNASERINNKWFRRVYWLLPFSIVDYFKKHRRFFCLESSILLESTDDSFAEHHEYLDQSINFISKRCHFLISTDSFSLHPLQIVDSLAESYWINRHMPKDPLDFVDKMVKSDPSVLLSRAKIWACSIGWW